MQTNFLFINKSAHSQTLSRSSGNESKVIRSHVQSSRKCSDDQPKAEHVQLVASNTCERDSCEESVSTRDRTSLEVIQRHLPWQPLNLQQKEARGLEFFMKHTALELSGWKDHIFWNELVIQALGHNTGLAHGLISLSVLHETSQPCVSRETAEYWHDFARTQKWKMVRAVNNSKVTHLVALISCIILICIQNFQESYHSYRILDSAIALLRELDQNTTSVTLAEREVVESILRPLVDRLKARLCMIGNPAATLLISIRNRPPKNTDPMAPSIPAAFVSLYEARNFLEAVLYWGRDSYPISNPTRTSRLEFQIKLRSLCNQWTAALRNRHCDKSKIPSDTERAEKLLKIACTFGRVILETFDSPSEMIFDNYLADFTHIIQLFNEIEDCHRPASQLSFGIDSGLIDILNFIGKSCRDPQIRRRVLDSLIKSGRTEGDRVGSIGVGIIQTLVSLEEQGLHVVSCADIPEHRRRRIYQGQQYRAMGQVRLILLTSPYDATNSSNTEEVWVSLNDSFHVKSMVVDNYKVQPLIPNTVYGPGYAMFLDDESVPTYHEVHISSFFFPIPRV